MKVLMIGSGGREHALAWKISQSPLLKKLYAAPGSAGIAQLAECIDIKADDIEGLVAFALKESINLTIVGPEGPLALGIADRFEKEGLKIFGPSKEAAQLEASKAFAKNRMSQFGIPTARHEVFTHINEAKHYVIESEMPLVIKADGLAAGKGVTICHNAQEAVEALNSMMTQHTFGEAGSKVVIEECLEGEEFSILAVTDGERILPLASAQDHKRAYDYDRGPNTGGMGAYSPCPQISEERFQEMVNLAIRPMVEGLRKSGIVFRGVMYAGIMMTKDGPYVLEYNVRFGDPEAQAILPRLKSDLLQVMKEVADGSLQMPALEWHDKSCLTVVLASEGYPGHYKKNLPISGLEGLPISDSAFIFHAGTALDNNGKWVSNGGRILSVSALGDTLKLAYDHAYHTLEKIRAVGSFYRRDIGKRALEVLR